MTNYVICAILYLVVGAIYYGWALEKRDTYIVWWHLWPLIPFMKLGSGLAYRYDKWKWQHFITQAERITSERRKDAKN